MNKNQYEFISNEISISFLKLWAITTVGCEACFDDDLATFMAFDGV